MIHNLENKLMGGKFIDNVNPKKRLAHKKAQKDKESTSWWWVFIIIMGLIIIVSLLLFLYKYLMNNPNYIIEHVIESRTSPPSQELSQPALEPSVEEQASVAPPAAPPAVALIEDEADSIFDDAQVSDDGTFVQSDTDGANFIEDGDTFKQVGGKISNKIINKTINKTINRLKKLY